MALIYRGTELARRIDISCVQAFHGAQDVVDLARTANEHGFVAAHALPNFVPLLKQELGSATRTLVAAPVGFPSGGATTNIKVAETSELVALGAQELDMMINVGRLVSGDGTYVANEIRAVVEAAGRVPLKVLLEIHYLNDDEIRLGCALAIEGGAAFVKTSSGWASGGAALEKVRVVAEATRGLIKIKASGGIRHLATIDALTALGVERFGINAKAAIALVAQGEEARP